MEQATFEDFQKLDLRVGEIIDAARIPGADRLLKLTVDFGEDAPRQIVAGIAEFVGEDIDKLIGKQAIFAANLEPRIIRGLKSNGMLLAVSSEEGGVPFTLLAPEERMPLGSKVH